MPEGVGVPPPVVGVMVDCVVVSSAEVAAPVDVVVKMGISEPDAMLYKS